MVKKSIVMFLTALALFFTAIAGAGMDNPIDNPENYHFCHRCGMAVEKSGPVMTVTDVTGGPWYQCCPICALMDIVESGNGSGTVNAFDSGDKSNITIGINKNKIISMEPESTVLLVGKSCLKNKIFVNRDAAMGFISRNKWAKKEMIKPVGKTYAMLSKKNKPMQLCSICTTDLKGREKTFSMIMTTGKKRMNACCGHCLLFGMYKTGDKVKRAVTTDYKTGRLISAENALYVVGNDKVTCCYPSTISFEDRKEAEAFQEKHNGEIMTLEEALKNIHQVMGKQRQP